MSLNTRTALKQLKILCLHGYRQNDNIFSKKTGGLRRTIKNYAKCVFINAPYVIPPGDGVTSNEEKDNDITQTDCSDTYGWWLFVKDKVSGSIRCEGLEGSVELIEKTFEEKGPFDGILAFSQGATFAGILSILLQEKSKVEFANRCLIQLGNLMLNNLLKLLFTELKAQFRFVLIIAGAHSLWEPLSKYSDTIINIPSLHIIGESDQIIPRERSEKFLRCFTNALHTTHPGGHYIPASSALKKVYCDFLEKQMLTEDAEHEANTCDN